MPRAVKPNESTALRSYRPTVTMRTTLVFLSLFGLAHSVQVYFHPPIDVSGSLPDSHANALVAKHLHLDQFEPLQDFYTGLLDQAFVGKGLHSSLLIGIDNEDVECQFELKERRCELTLCCRHYPCGRPSASPLDFELKSCLYLLYYHTDEPTARRSLLRSCF